MSSTNLTERANQWGIIINPPSDNSLSLETIYNQLKGGVNFIACICHDRDTKQDGTLKTLHYHVVITTSRLRKQTILNDLTEWLNLPLECLSVEKIRNINSAIRYLCHLDDTDKQRYAPFEILTNDEEYLKNNLTNEQITNLDESTLIKLCKEASSYAEILLKIGSQQFKTNLPIIRVLFNECHKW